MQFVNARPQWNVVGKIPVSPMPEQHRIAGSGYDTVRTIPRPAKMKILVGLPDVSGGVDLRFSTVASENAEGYSAHRVRRSRERLAAH